MHLPFTHAQQNIYNGDNIFFVNTAKRAVPENDTRQLKALPTPYSRIPSDNKFQLTSLILSDEEPGIFLFFFTRSSTFSSSIIDYCIIYTKAR